PAEAGPQGADQALGIGSSDVVDERDGDESRHREKSDRLDLAEPASSFLAAARAARALARPVAGGGSGRRGHQTSRMRGSTMGLRWKRWLMRWRTVVRTWAAIASRSKGAPAGRSARAFVMAIRSSSSSGSFSFT